MPAIYFKIVGDARNIKKALADIKGQLKGVKLQVEKSSKSFLGFDKSTLIAAAGLGSVTAAASKAWRELREIANVQDQIAKDSKRFGVAVETLSGLRLAAELSGTSIQDLGTGMRRLAANAFDVSQGTGEAQAAFRIMGISVVDSSGKLKDQESLLLEVADSFSQMDDATQKAAIAQDVFGRAGTQLIPLLNEGSAGLQEMRADAERLGIVFDAETAAGAEQFNDSLTRLDFAVEGLTMALSTGLIPRLTQAAEELTDVVTATQKLGVLGTIVMGVINPGALAFDGLTWAIHGTGEEAEKTAEQFSGLEQKAVDLGLDLEGIPKRATKSLAGLIPVTEAWRRELEETSREARELQAELSRLRALGEIEFRFRIIPTYESAPAPGGPTAGVKPDFLPEVDLTGRDIFAETVAATGGAHIPTPSGGPGTIIDAERLRQDSAEVGAVYDEFLASMSAKTEAFRGIMQGIADIGGQAFVSLGAALAGGGEDAAKQIGASFGAMLAGIGSGMVAEGLAHILLGSSPMFPRPDAIAHGGKLIAFGAPLAIGGGFTGAKFGGAGKGKGGVFGGGFGAGFEQVSEAPQSVNFNRQESLLDHLRTMPPGVLVYDGFKQRGALAIPGRVMTDITRRSQGDLTGGR